MKSSIIAASALLMASAASAAQPHAHQHQKLHEKREVVWTIAYEVVTETIPITTTVWVEANEVAATTTSSGNPGQFYETTSAVSVAVVPTTSSKATTLVTSSTAAPVAAAPKVVSPAPLASTSSTPAAAVVTPTVAAVVAPAPVASSAAPSSSAAAAASNQQVASSGYSGVCSAASPCTDDITYYEAGLGACGDVTNGNTTRVIALPYEMMGTKSNGNPFCGMTVTITKGSKSTVATVVDKCMGCKGASIDLSNLAFEELADFGVGRTTATWYFN